VLRGRLKSETLPRPLSSSDDLKSTSNHRYHLQDLTLLNMSDPVAEKSGFLCMYMSGHPDTLVAYAKWYGKVEEPIVGAKMTSIDCNVGFRMASCGFCATLADRYISRLTENRVAVHTKVQVKTGL
jgi:Protein of unknown function (DUF2470)